MTVATTVVAAVALIAAAGGVASAKPSQPAKSGSSSTGRAQPSEPSRASTSSKPTVASVRKTLGLLSDQNEALTEQFNAASIDVTVKQAQAAAAEVTARKAALAYTTARAQVRLSLQAQYRGGSVPDSAVLLTSDSGQDYLDESAALSQLSSRRTGLATQLLTTRQVAAAASRTATTLLTAATTTRDALAVRRASLAAQQKKYRTLLDTLNAAQRRIFLNNGSKVVSTKQLAALGTAPAPSPAAAEAVAFALAQRGKPYVYATSGPRTFDCSGLTAAAWAHAGKQIPHQSRMQYALGHHVAKNQLEPGDLVFYFNPIHHVALYIGNGLVVEAPQTGDVVKVVPVDRAGSYTGATRL